MSEKDSIYVDKPLKKRLKGLKPDSVTLRGFLETLANAWEGMTEQERLTNILTHRQNQQPKEATCQE